MTPAERDVRAAAMRSLGMTVPDIAETLGVSESTVKRALKRAGATKGELYDEVLTQAREELIASVSSDEELKALAGVTLRGTLRLSERLQEKIGEAIDNISDEPSKALLQARAINSLANGVKLSSDAVRSSIKIAPISSDDEDEELPELVFREMTDTEVQRLRDQQAREYEEERRAYEAALRKETEQQVAEEPTH